MTNNTQDALRIALEALEGIASAKPSTWQYPQGFEAWAQNRAQNAFVALSAQIDATQPVQAEIETCQAVGIKRDGTLEVISPIPLPPEMKAREIVRSYFNDDMDDEMSDSSMALECCKELIKWMRGQDAARATPAARPVEPQPAVAKHETHTKLPWRITDAAPKKRREIVGSDGSTVAELTALDMANAHLIVSAVNSTAHTHPSAAQPQPNLTPGERGAAEAGNSPKTSSFAKQVADAQAEVSTWPEEKRKSVQIEGGR